jgi:SAM-dependent methyltransferase
MLVEEALRQRYVIERKLAEHARRARELERHFRLLRRALGLRKVFMEVGAGAGALAQRVAGYVERAYAVDTSARATHGLRRPGNVVALRADASGIPVPEGTVDVAFSRELVAQQLPAIHRALAPGGRYLCLAPKSSRATLAAAGFRKLRCYARVAGCYARLPFPLDRLFGACIEAVK